jgi:hypothetical protein
MDPLEKRKGRSGERLGQMHRRSLLGYRLTNGAGRREVRKNQCRFQDDVSPPRKSSGRAVLLGRWTTRRAESPDSRGGVQFDRANTSTGRQIEDYKLSAPFGEGQSEDETIRPDSHRLDTSAARDIDGRPNKRARGSRARPAARYPRSDYRD